MGPRMTSAAGDAVNQPLTAAVVATSLARFPGWSGDTAALRRTYRFPGFTEALAFMSGCVPEIERLGHHPEWRNVYDRVDVTLTTHDAGGRVTRLDLDLAGIIDGHARRLGGA